MNATNETKGAPSDLALAISAGIPAITRQALARRGIPFPESETVEVGGPLEKPDNPGEQG